MVAPVYGTDLIIHDDCTNAANFSEPTGFTDLDGSGVNDTDLAIYGTQCVSESMRKTQFGALVSGPAARTLPTNGAFFCWFKWFAPNSLANKSAGGIRFFVGNTTANFNQWFVDGADTYSLGGWKNYAVDPTKTGDAGDQQGNPNTTYQQVGVGVNCPVSTPQKGNSYTIDIIRYGRGQLQMTGGDASNGYANFDSAALFNDSVNGRYGLFSDVGGSYSHKGVLQFGTTGSAVDFRDTNKTITIENTEYVDSDFNRYEVNNTSSNVEWTGITISSLSERSRGNFVLVDSATILKDACTFTDMGYFIYNAGISSNTIIDTTYRRCQAITMNGATITGGLIEDTFDSSGVIIADSAGLGLNDLNTIFSRSGGNTSHAVKITDTIVGDISRTWNNTFSGYTTGTTGTVTGPSGVDSAVLEVNVASGSELTLNISSTADIPSVQNLGSGDVTVVAAVTVTLTGIKDNTEARIFNTGTTTEVAGVESLSGGVGTGLNNGTAGGSTDDNSFSFSSTVGTGLDIRLINVADWVHDDIINYIVPSGGGTVPISSRPERVYTDPD